MTQPKADHLRIMATGSVSAQQAPPRAKILCVDDEFTVLESLERILRTRFDVDKASSAQDVEDALRHGGPYAVVISDLRLADTDGIQVLAKFRQSSPDTVRLLITGYADMDSAINAINEGNVFAFLRKPCRADALLERVADAVHHHHVLSVERTVVEQSTRGAIEAMNQIVALNSPASAARATRLAHLAGGVADVLNLSRVDIELAALASQLGAASVERELAERIACGGRLSASEQHVASQLPAVAASLIASLPRSQVLQEILRSQACRDPLDEKPRPIGASILRAVFEFDDRRLRGESVADAFAGMRATLGVYNCGVLDALMTTVNAIGAEPPRFDRTPRSVRRVAS